MLWNGTLCPCVDNAKIAECLTPINFAIYVCYVSEILFC